jgi:ATP-dependent helicase/nuclease subunit B
MIDEAPPLHPLDARFVTHLEAGGAIVTATRRQARLIRRRFDDAQVATGRRTWPTANVLPLSAWVAARWQEAARRDESLPRLLTDTQASWSWRRHAGSFVDAALVDPHDLAEGARRAWVSLIRHGGSLALLDTHSLTQDQAQFRAWAAQVETDLLADGWLDPGSLESALAHHTGLLAPSAPLLLAGFAQLPAAVDALLRALIACGWSVEIAPLAGQTGQGHCFGAADPAAEIAAMAAWARQRLESDPGARLAVIVADLQSRRAALERRFEAELQPELELPGTLERDRLFDFAGGPPLSSFGVAEAALDCLESSASRIRHETLSRLLRCPYVAQAGEVEARVRLDVSLRRQPLLERPVLPLAYQARAAGCPLLADSLEAAHRVMSEGADLKGTDSWAEVFGRALSVWGWPGDRPLASDEFQTAQELRERLDSFAGLSRSAPVMKARVACSEFGRLVAAPYQPERGDASVIVFDSLEPPGTTFDGLWVSGMTASAWPRAAVQDPFIPLSLQTALGMPGITADTALAEALATTEAWLGSAPEVVFSWPERQDDAAVEPSRILPAALAQLPVARETATRTRLLFGTGSREALPADPAPALTGVEPGGGSRSLELQAKCPFRAFAELRLAAGRLEEPAAGVDARGRGVVLHRALELAWGSLASQVALLEATPESLDALKESALGQALAEELPAAAGSRAVALEAEWQRAALARLLELDRERPAFELVALEQEIEANFAGLRLRLRVDRIDRVDAGLVVIDYKTGRAETSQWRGARLDAPQLPLYALQQKGGVAGIAFASVGAQAARLRGVGASDAIADGVVPAEKFALTEDRQDGFSWQQVQEHWAGWLASLARGYIEGSAVVDPKQPQTCRLCHLQTLCRVAPELDLDRADDDDE